MWPQRPETDMEARALPHVRERWVLMSAREIVAELREREDSRNRRTHKRVHDWTDALKHDKRMT